MKNSGRRGGVLWGLLLLLVVVGVTAAYSLVRTGRLEPTAPAGTVLTGLVGDEALPFLTDPEVQAILRERYDLALDARPTSPGEMVRRGGAEADFLWATSEVTAATYRLTGGPLIRAEEVLRSPLVLYTWSDVAEALAREGLAEAGAAGYYTVDMDALLGHLAEGRTWAEWGVEGLPGTVGVAPPDPRQSAVGGLYVELLAETLGGEGALPEIRALLAGQGYLYPTAGALFRQYVRQGPGAWPLVVGLESQLVALRAEHPEERARIDERLRTLYPRPAVWAVHSLLVLTERAAPLAEALGDGDIRHLARTRYGFRSAQEEMHDPAAPEPAGPAVTIDPATIDRIILGLGQ